MGHAKCYSMYKTKIFPFPHVINRNAVYTTHSKLNKEWKWLLRTRQTNQTSTKVWAKG
jgi:hypothetical protein